MPLQCPLTAKVGGGGNSRSGRFGGPGFEPWLCRFLFQELWPKILTTLTCRILRCKRGLNYEG